MKLKIYTDGFEGFAERQRERAKAIAAGERVKPSRGITFESAAEMVRLLTPARLELFATLKKKRVSITELAEALERDIRAVRRDVNALERVGLVESEHVVNPGHGRIRMVFAPGNLTITAHL